MKVGIICAEGLEECEALIVYDLLYRAKIDVKLLGLDKKDIASSHNVNFKTDLLLNDTNIDEYDCIVLPGGMPGMKNLENSTIVQTIIDNFVDNKKLIAAICSAPTILIHKGLLKANEYTCHHSVDEVKDAIKQKVVVHNNFITGNAMGGTIEFALKIIEVLINKETAESIKNSIEY